MRRALKNWLLLSISTVTSEAVTAFAFEKMTGRKYEYIKGFNGHFELALYVEHFEDVDLRYRELIEKGAASVLEPTTEPWGQRTCYIADPEGNLIEIGSFNKPFER